MLSPLGENELRGSLATGRLRENCGANGVRALWEFEVLRRLVERDFMSAADLVAVAARVEEANPYLSGITERLRCLLGFVKR